MSNTDSNNNCFREFRVGDTVLAFDPLTGEFTEKLIETEEELKRILHSTINQKPIF